MCRFSIDATTLLHAGYGFAMGQIYYIRELAPNGPAKNSAEIQPGDRVIEVQSLLFLFSSIFMYSLFAVGLLPVCLDA